MLAQVLVVSKLEPELAAPSMDMDREGLGWPLRADQLFRFRVPAMAPEDDGLAAATAHCISAHRFTFLQPLFD
jgi:hypothetical protein